MSSELASMTSQTLLNALEGIVYLTNQHGMIVAVGQIR
jgi:hypothetical protein